MTCNGIPETRGNSGFGNFEDSFPKHLKKREHRVIVICSGIAYINVS